MVKNLTFYTHTALGNGLKSLLLAAEQRLELTRPLAMYLAGGMAVHLYVGSRVTTDVDAEFNARVLIPSDLAVQVELENGAAHVIYLDTNYNSTFALMHEDYRDDALRVALDLKYLELNILAPVDLAVSKIARLADSDREDICALVKARLVTANEIEARALAAQVGFVGGHAMLTINIRDAVAMARKIESELQ